MQHIVSFQLDIRPLCLQASYSLPTHLSRLLSVSALSLCSLSLAWYRALARSRSLSVPSLLFLSPRSLSPYRAHDIRIYLATCARHPSLSLSLSPLRLFRRCRLGQTGHRREAQRGPVAVDAAAGGIQVVAVDAFDAAAGAPSRLH